MTTTKTTTAWAQAWAVRYDGTAIDAFKSHLSADGRTVTVRSPHATGGGGRHNVRYYEETFGATRREAIDKARARAQRDIALAEQELQDARALLARVEQLAAEEPQETVQ